MSVRTTTVGSVVNGCRVGTAAHDSRTFIIQSSDARLESIASESRRGVAGHHAPFAARGLSRPVQVHPKDERRGHKIRARPLGGRAPPPERNGTPRRDAREIGEYCHTSEEIALRGRAPRPRAGDPALLGERQQAEKNKFTARGQSGLVGAADEDAEHHTMGVERHARSGA